MGTMQRPAALAGRKRFQVTFVVRDEVERCHRAGVNSLQYDAHLQRLFTAGRDGVIRMWNCKNTKEPYIQSMEHHTDWVNDIVLCCGGRNLISASSDTTVKVWSAHKGLCMSTLRTHKDYVKALAYAKEKEHVASAGLDKSIFLWDVNTLTALTTSNNIVTTSSLNGSKFSIYSLGMNELGTVVIAGSTEKLLRVWDPRTCDRLMKLRGHADNVRAVLVSRDGTQCLSGSSDGTVKLWSLGQQRCITTLQLHDSVWALQVSPDFSRVYSGGRDRRLLVTNLRQPDSSLLLAEETAPILRMALVGDESIWVSTAESSVKNWSLKNVDRLLDDAQADFLTPVASQPTRVIEGAPSIKQYKVLNDKRHVLTRDSDGQVALYDVLYAKKVEDLGQIDLEAEAERRFKMVYVPNWFSIDLKTGYLSVHLSQDEVDCFSAWVSAKEAGLQTSDGVDQKVNYGRLLLQALLEHWPRTFQLEPGAENGSDAQALAKPVGNEYFSVPPHTPVIFSEAGGRFFYRLLCRDAVGESEGTLNEMVPDWVVDCVVERNTPKFIKVPFYLQPHASASNSIKHQKKDRLIANDFIQVRKVVEHVYEKVLGTNSEAMGGGPAQPPPPAAGAEADDRTEGSATLAEDKVELLCNEQVLDLNMDLRTVRHFIWKNSADLQLHYRQIK
ncbi:WD repeat-containing protein 48 [Amphibalanus amphitrite]|uniref:WD repeat-containing protein 48 homolog n=1 Tax=Amphibalanus amphitrite TaxID=1232801 RepID=A0A6A4WIV5_AMPAM|nr:WD repeat-containing protein 48-like [Amphibalanus amphitrite]KAF0301841.1 WD repeat-containing protein 48 [Amphibalanus amphitrite]